jgi:uncharacterized membrane protein
VQISQIAVGRQDMGPMGGQFYEQADHLQRTAQTALSVLWAVWAALLLTVGLRLPSKPLRWAALGLFGLTLGKVVLIDTARLSGFYRAAVFLVLSLMMGVAAWGYQKVKLSLLAGEPEEGQHETV